MNSIPKKYTYLYIFDSIQNVSSILSSYQHSISSPIIISFPTFSSYNSHYPHLQSFFYIPLILQDFINNKEMMKDLYFQELYSLLILKNSYDVIVHIHSSFTFPSLSLPQFLQNYESTFTLYQFDSHHSYKNYLDFYNPIQQKTILFKLNQQDLFQHSFHIYHSHLLTHTISNYPFILSPNNNLTVSIESKLSVVPVGELRFFIFYIFSLILSNHIHLYSLQYNFSSPTSNLITHFKESNSIHHLLLSNI